MVLEAAIRWARGVETAWRDLGAWQARASARSLLRQQAGLTVVELCVDVSMIAILALSAVVMASHYLESGRVRTAAEQVAGSFQQARQYAISNAARYTVTLTGSSVAVACTTGCPPSAPSEPATPITSGATTTVPSPPITFDSMGCGNSTGACAGATTRTVTVTYPGATQWQVRVTATGRVRLCSPTCT